MIIITATGRRFRPEDFVSDLEARVFDGEISPEVAMINLRCELGSMYELGSENSLDQFDRFLESAYQGERKRKGAHDGTTR